MSRWLGDIQSAQSSVPGIRLVDRGDVDWEWAPPAMTTRSMPARIDAAALCTADRDEAQCRLWADTGRMDQARLDGRVTGDVTAAVEALPEHHVVDQQRVDAGPPDRLRHDAGGQLEGVHVEERPFERRPDRAASRRDDHRFMHRSLLLCWVDCMLRLIWP